MSFAEVKDREEIMAFVDNPAQLTYVAVTEENPHEGALPCERAKRNDD